MCGLKLKMIRAHIIAPFTFSILKSDDKLKKDLDERRKSVPSVFTRDDRVAKSQSTALSDFFSKVRTFLNSLWKMKEKLIKKKNVNHLF